MIEMAFHREGIECLKERCCCREACNTMLGPGLFLLNTSQHPQGVEGISGCDNISN